MKNKYITKFRSYDELPFSEEIQNYLFAKHEHFNEGAPFEQDIIIYSEEDVLIMLQMLQDEKNKEIDPNTFANYIKTQSITIELKQRVKKLDDTYGGWSMDGVLEYGFDGSEYEGLDEILNLIRKL